MKKVLSILLTIVTSFILVSCKSRYDYKVDNHDLKNYTLVSKTLLEKKEIISKLDFNKDKERLLFYQAKIDSSESQNDRVYMSRNQEIKQIVTYNIDENYIFATSYAAKSYFLYKIRNTAGKVTDEKKHDVNIIYDGKIIAVDVLSIKAREDAVINKKGKYKTENQSSIRIYANGAEKNIIEKLKYINDSDSINIYENNNIYILEIKNSASRLTIKYDESYKIIDVYEKYNQTMISKRENNESKEVIEAELYIKYSVDIDLSFKYDSFKEVEIIDIMG